MSEPTPFPTVLESDRSQEVWIVQPPRQRLWLHVLLLLATFLSTLVVGARMQFNFMHAQPVFSLTDDSLSLFPLGWILLQPSNLLLGIPFSLTLMFILLAHEMGHYLYARHYRVYATLPYFIPFPSLIGTLGAFIRIKSRIPSRAALFDIGIAGPIAGFIPACVAMLAGLSLSHPAAAPSASDIQLGFPQSFHLAAHLLHITTPLDRLSLHPIAAAAWIGMFATALNLLPGGQLDGGHISRAVFGPDGHRIATYVGLGILLIAGFWPFALLVLVMMTLSGRGFRGVEPLDDVSPVSNSRKVLYLLGMAMLVLTFAYLPIQL